MATTQLPAPQSPNNPAARQRVRVMRKEKWTDPWVELGYIEPLWAENCVGPSISQASFLWRYGRIKREDQTTFSQYDPLDMRGYFVKIELLPDAPPENGTGSGGADGQGGNTSNGPEVTPSPAILFIGRFNDDNFEDHEPRASGDSSGAVGNQTINAVGLEDMLEQSEIVGSYVKATAAATAPVQIDHQITFNERHGMGFSDAVKGNRTAEKLDTIFGGYSMDAYAFAGGSVGSDKWLPLDAIEYFLTWYPPGDTSTGVVDVEISGQIENLDHAPVGGVDLGGTVSKAIDKLIDRRRGMGWCLRYSDDQNGHENVLLHLFAAFGEDVSVGDTTIFGNLEQSVIELNASSNIEEAVSRIDSSSQYDLIIVRGERVKSCFTVTVADGTLEKNWTTAEETAYKAGYTGAGATAELHDKERHTDKFAHVFTSFRIPESFDWTINGHNVNPKVLDDGSVTDQDSSPIRNWGHVILRSLPFKAQATAADREEEYLASPMVVINTATSPNYDFSHVEELGSTTSFAGANTGAHPLQHGFGFQLKPTFGHAFAKNHWSGAAATKNTPLLDYTSLVATVCVELDARLQVMVRPSGAPATDPEAEDPSPPGRVMTINVPGAEFWFVSGQTLKEIKNGMPVYHPPLLAGDVDYDYLRNDADRLRLTAALAKAWYAKPRYATRITLTEISTAYPVGSYINSVVTGDEDRNVDAVVTKKRYDFKQMRTTIETGYIELDFGGLATSNGGKGGKK